MSFTAALSRAARGLLDWSQTELGRRSNLSESTIRDFEKGRRLPSPNNVAAIRAALEIRRRDLRGGERRGAGSQIEEGEWQVSVSPPTKIRLGNTYLPWALGGLMRFLVRSFGHEETHMSRGAGRVQQIIRDMIAAEPNGAWTTDEICRRVYFGANVIEKKHQSRGSACAAQHAICRGRLVFRKRRPRRRILPI